MHSNIEYAGNVVHKCKNKGASHCIQKWNTSWQERVGISKNGRIQHKKGLAYPKMEEFSTRRGWHIQKQGRKGQNGVHASKNRTIQGQKGLAHTKMRQLRPDRVSTCKKGTIQSQKVSAHPKK